MPDLSIFQRDVTQYLSEKQQAFLANISWTTFGDTIFDVLESTMVRVAKELLSGEEKKAQTLAALRAFLEAVPTPLPWYLSFLRPFVINVICWLAEGFIEAIYTRLKKHLDPVV
jgi:hypothetical protein